MNTFVSPSVSVVSRQDAALSPHGAAPAGAFGEASVERRAESQGRRDAEDKLPEHRQPQARHEWPEGSPPPALRPVLDTGARS